MVIPSFKKYQAINYIPSVHYKLLLLTYGISVIEDHISVKHTMRKMGQYS